MAAGQQDYCRERGNKRQEEAIVRRKSPAKHAAPGQSGPLQKCAVVVGFCWGGLYDVSLYNNFASVMWL